MNDSIAAWLSAFAFTQAVEVPIYVLGLGIDGAEDATVARRAAIGFGASAITHPIVWFVIPGLVPWGYWSMVAVAETFAVLAEAAYLRGFRLDRPLWWSLLANASSAGLGLLCRSAFGWP